MQISLNDIKQARESRDPQLPGLCITLARSDHPLRSAASGEEEADKALEHYFKTIDSSDFSALPELEKARFRVEQFKRIEDDKAVRTPERYRLYPVLLELWKDNSPYARRCLKEIISGAPLCHGVWKGMKRIYKEAEEKTDTEMLGAIAARLDRELAENYSHPEVRRGTIIYMVRRVWRFLRNLGNCFSSLYCRCAVDVLQAYTENTQWNDTWIANHIFFHESRRYSSKSFLHGIDYNDLLRHRAFAELWQRDPQPLLHLLEEAQSAKARIFAAASLKKEHRIALREISAGTVLCLLKAGEKEIDTFCVWLFDSVPRFEQTRLRELGLHEAVIGLLQSQSNEAVQFAAGYVRSHARDLPLDQVLELVNHHHKDVRKLAEALLSAKDPRKEIGLDAWARLLGTSYGNSLAETAIIKHFSAGELTPGWFSTLLLNPSSHAFAKKQLLSIHKLKDLGVGYFTALFFHENFERFCVPFVMEQLRNFRGDELDREFLREALFCTLTQNTVIKWVQTGYCDSGVFGADFLTSLAIEAEWEKNNWIQERITTDKERKKPRYAGVFDQTLSDVILGWLSDVSKFQPKDIGFSRLMELIKSKDERYHNFALRYMTKAFVPGDFAPETAGTEQADGQSSRPGEVDLEGQSFLFTGKLKTMTRDEAQQKVTAAKGQNSASVTKNLHYLVIGDEGSPLFGAGAKGSKQLKAESLIAAGAPLKIISETAFLQILAGRRQKVDDNSTQAGCEQLWEYITKKGSEQNPVRLFAIHYIRHHHQDIGPGLTERPVDPGSEIPHAFFTFDRLLPLFKEKRQTLVSFALELARWEAARWCPPFQKLLELCEKGSHPVRTFIAKALTAGPEKEHIRYRFPGELIIPDNVYRLCESPEDFARNLGMQLLNLHPHLADASSLFRLTESADRRMRYFAVEMIWHSFRDRGVSANWTSPPEEAMGGSVVPEKAPSIGKSKASKANEVDAKDKKNRAETVQQQKAPGPWLAEKETMQSFLRRMLFEIPPGRERGKRKGLKTLPSGKAKTALVETYRNIALGDADFAAMVVPVLAEFMASRGLMEERACLVALARIARKHPGLGVVKSWQENVKESTGL